MRSWDVKLADTPFILAAPAGIKLATKDTEPGNDTALGTAVVGSLHGGIGRQIDDGIGRYLQAVDADLSVPGMMLPAFDEQSVGSFTATNVRNTLPTFCWQGSDVYVVAGRVAKKFTPSDASPSLTAITVGGAGWPSNAEFSGSMFRFNNYLVFGVVTDGVATAEGTVTTLTGTTITLDTNKKVSFGASARGKAFWINESNALMWAPTGVGVTWYPSTVRGPQVIGDTPLVTWVAMIGTAVLLFTEVGEILGADETALWSVAGLTMNAPVDHLFGRRTTPWQDVLLIPSKTGLWSFHGQNLLTRALGGNYVQTTIAERLRGEAVVAGAAAGPYAFVSQRVPGVGGYGDHTQVFKLVHYEQATAIHDFMGEQATETMVTDFLLYFNVADRVTRLYYLTWEPITDAVEVKWRSLRLPTDWYKDSTYIANPNTVKLAEISGQDAAQNMTKLWLQVRGHFEFGSASGPTVSFANVEIDGKSVSIADVTAEGDFAVPITEATAGNLLGRKITRCEISINDAAYDTQLLFPLSFDYIWAPSFEDGLELDILLASDVQGNVQSMWQGSAREAQDFVSALQHTVTTLEFRDDDRLTATPWNVYVEDVQITHTSNTENTGQVDRVARLMLRRL